MGQALNGAINKIYNNDPRFVALTRYGFLCWKTVYAEDGTEFSSDYEYDVSFDARKAVTFSDVAGIKKAAKSFREGREFDGKNYEVVGVFETALHVMPLDYVGLNSVGV